MATKRKRDDTTEEETESIPLKLTKKEQVRARRAERKAGEKKQKRKVLRYEKEYFIHMLQSLNDIKWTSQETARKADRYKKYDLSLQLLVRISYPNTSSLIIPPLLTIICKVNKRDVVLGSTIRVITTGYTATRDCTQ